MGISAQNDELSRKINKIADDLYSPEIQNNLHTESLFRSVLKSLFRSAVIEGIEIGKNELALELEKTILKNRDPNVILIEYRK